MSMAKHEEWMPVMGGRYQVSSRGRVRSAFYWKRGRDWRGDPCAVGHRPRILQPSAGGTVTLYDGQGNRRTASVASLVAQAFQTPGLFPHRVNPRPR